MKLKKEEKYTHSETLSVRGLTEVSHIKKKGSGWALQSLTEHLIMKIIKKNVPHRQPDRQEYLQC